MLSITLTRPWRRHSSATAATSTMRRFGLVGVSKMSIFVLGRTAAAMVSGLRASNSENVIPWFGRIV